MQILAKHQGKHADIILYLGITMTQAGLNSRHCATHTKLTCSTASWQAKGSVSLCISWAIPVSGSEKTRSKRVWNKNDGRCDLMGTQSLCTERAGMARVCQDACIYRTLGLRKLCPAKRASSPSSSSILWNADKEIVNGVYYGYYGYQPHIRYNPKKS